MPNELFAILDAFKGKEWLWENYLPGLRALLEAKEYQTDRRQSSMHFSDN